MYEVNSAASVHLYQRVFLLLPFMSHEFPVVICGHSTVIPASSPPFLQLYYIECFISSVDIGEPLWTKMSESETPMPNQRYYS